MDDNTDGTNESESPSLDGPAADVPGPDVLSRDVEARLRRYRPVGPSAALRGRIVSAPRTFRTWPWIAAAAALLLTTVGLQGAAARLTATADVNPGSVRTASTLDALDDGFDRAEEAPAGDMTELLLAIEQEREVERDSRTDPASNPGATRPVSGAPR